MLEGMANDCIAISINSATRKELENSVDTGASLEFIDHVYSSTYKLDSIVDIFFKRERDCLNSVEHSKLGILIELNDSS